VLMAKMAAGDRAAPFALYSEFGNHMASMLRRQLARLGVNSIDPVELDGLVIDACLALFDCAAGWDPDGGALPWNWAARRLAGIASAWVGQHADSFDPARHDIVAAAEMGAPDDDAGELEVLARLAPCHDGCALLLEALGRVASERDQTIVLELRTQEVSSDPSPALTVAARHGLQPAAVRQVACRVRSRLRRLAADEARFAMLSGVPLVA
jgi:hypothetical protein